MANIVFRHIYKDYTAGNHAVNNFNLEIEDKEFIVFVGPSGCGKSTTLRMVAGLEEVTSGEIYIDDKCINDLHPKDRNIAMVFQNYALYPHMSVFQNMGFGLKMKKKDVTTIQRKVESTAEILDLKPYLDRKPKELSGGQRQRVALGRAIVQNAKVFLMDEPLSNLDAKLRTQTRAELIRLHAKLQATTIYVTHDQTEAMSMATRIVVMNEGIIQQVGTPKEIYLKPCNTFVAGFIGAPPMNFLDMVVKEHALYLDGVKYINLPDILYSKLIEKGYKNQLITFGIRAENIRCARESELEDMMFRFNTQVDVAELTGSETLVHYYLGKHRQIAKFYTMDDFKSGEALTIEINLQDAHFFDFKTGERIVLNT